MRFLRVFYFQINYMLYWRFHFEKEIPINCSFTHYELEHIYWILDLDEVHSIWVIWTSGLQSQWRTTPRYWRNYTKRQLLLWRDARILWAGKRKVSRGSGGGGPHPHLSHRTELVGVPLVSANLKYHPCALIIS